MIGSDKESIRIESFTDSVIDGETLYYEPDGIEASASLAGLNHFDYTIPFKAKLDGVQPIAKNHSFGDYVYMELGYIDPSNQQFVKVDKFGRKILFDDSVQNQGWLKTDYSATIPKYVETDPVNISSVLRIYYFRKHATLISNLIFNFSLHELRP